MSREIVLVGQVSGTRNGKDWPLPGSRLELTDDEANGLVQSGMAYEVDDERVAHIGNGNGGVAFSDELLAGAPTGRDWTEGQQDTNLSRARALALDERDTRKVTRDAAERAQLDDAHTLPQANPDAAVVGDDKPNPTDLPSLVALPQEVKVDGKPDDGAKLIDDKRQKGETRKTERPVESADITTNSGSTETATANTTPRSRNTSK
jgi:hypothetical protein